MRKIQKKLQYFKHNWLFMKLYGLSLNFFLNKYLQSSILSHYYLHCAVVTSHRHYSEGNSTMEAAVAAVVAVVRSKQPTPVRHYYQSLQDLHQSLFEDTGMDLTC